MMKDETLTVDTKQDWFIRNSLIRCLSPISLSEHEKTAVPLFSRTRCSINSIVMNSLIMLLNK